MTVLLPSCHEYSGKKLTLGVFGIFMFIFWLEHSGYPAKTLQPGDTQRYKGLFRECKGEWERQYCGYFAVETHVDSIFTSSAVDK